VDLLEERQDPTTPQDEPKELGDKDEDSNEAKEGLSQSLMEKS